jgi:mRNA interferase MazF
MPNMTTYNQGDVLLVPFPFTDQSGTKQRPAVVLSSNKYNRSHPDIILAPITSQAIRDADETSLVDWQAAGLLKPSVVKPVLSSFDTRLVRRQLGTLTPADRTRVRTAFAQILDLQ